MQKSAERGRSVKPLTALDSPAIWPLGGCSEMESADPVAQRGGGGGGRVRRREAEASMCNSGT